MEMRASPPNNPPSTTQVGALSVRRGEGGGTFIIMAAALPIGFPSREGAVVAADSCPCVERSDGKNGKMFSLSLASAIRKISVQPPRKYHYLQAEPN